MKTVKFEGIFPALITPLEADNKTVCVKCAEELIDYQLNQGADGFYILGATGEGLVMDKEQRMIMCETAIRHINGRKPVICHIAAINLDDALELARHAEKAGADAIAAVPPFFFFYDGDDIYNYYKRIADSVNIPVIIYYHPAAQKDMSAELIAKIYEIDNVTGVKWSSNNLYQMMMLKDKTHGEMNIINGPDELLISGLAAGADAGIGATYNVMLPEFLKIYSCFKSGNIDGARAAQLKVNRVINVMFKYEVIPAIKFAASLLGFNVGSATYPMKSYTKSQAKSLETELRACMWPFER
ncbi:MAG: dihydrodipicolinate synthase family protein [Clostridia bacterium]|nr:dihydrodipicolinate synthase family protein [Clostridia bacterium]